MLQHDDRLPSAASPSVAAATSTAVSSVTQERRPARGDPLVPHPSNHPSGNRPKKRVVHQVDKRVHHNRWFVFDASDQGYVVELAEDGTWREIKNSIRAKG